MLVASTHWVPNPANFHSDRAPPLYQGETMIAKDITNYRMNQTEQRWAGELEGWRLAGDIKLWRFEAVKFRLADNCFYTPDFWVLLSDNTVEIHEIKGFWRDDAKVKFRAVADAWPEFVWVSIRRIKGKWEKEVY